ncbi:MAG: hypothetical protein M1461_07120 [Nitrospirae bacterium]|nr:hypothetical protein [Nitrospirota bacterium]
MVEDLPPLITASLCMAAFGATVTVVAAGCDGNIKELLLSKGIMLSLLDYGGYPSSKVGKLLLRAQFIKLLRKVSDDTSDVIWLHGTHAMAYQRVLPSRKGHILVAHAHELEERYRLRRIQKIVLRKADMYLVPEENRGWLLKGLTGTKAPFFVIHNRPVETIIPEVYDTDFTAEAFWGHGGNKECRKFFIYQGLFAEDRCLKELILGFQMLEQSDIGLILLGSGTDKKYTDELRRLIRTDARIVIIPRIPAPNHLLVTEGCSWGAILYRPTCLNNIYCAPNKIFEYSFFGLGMLLPAFPGLENINQKYALGELCDPQNPASIARALGLLVKRDGDSFKEATKKFLAEMKSPLESYEIVHRYILSQDPSHNG